MLTEITSREERVRDYRDLLARQTRQAHQNLMKVRFSLQELRIDTSGGQVADGLNLDHTVADVATLAGWIEDGQLDRRVRELLGEDRDPFTGQPIVEDAFGVRQ